MGGNVTERTPLAKGQESSQAGGYVASSSSCAQSSTQYRGSQEQGWEARLDEYFSVTKRGSTVTNEIRSGVVTFFTMAYILVLNAQILSLSSADPTKRMPFGAVATATAVSSAIASILTGYLGNLPFGLAPGMGINSYFTYGMCLRLGLTWQVALACSFVTGVLFLILSVTGACTVVQLYAPVSVKKGITVGLGLFQALIGFEMMKLVVAGEHTLLSVGDVSDPAVLLSCGGVLLICALMVLNVKASMIIGLAVVTVASWGLGLQAPPTSIMSVPSVAGTFMQLDFAGFIANLSVTLPLTLIVLFVAVFDTAGVHYALGHQAGLLDEETHTLPGASGAFASASVASIVGACLGTSPVIIHNESCAGIQDGARTGLNAVTIGVCFIVSLPFVPVLECVPLFASSAPLIVVGMLMMSAAKFIDWTRIEEALPAFLTISVLPLTYSIANGMVAGIASYAVLKPFAVYADSVERKAREAQEAAAAAATTTGAGAHGPVVGGEAVSFVAGAPRPSLSRTPSRAAHGFVPESPGYAAAYAPSGELHAALESSDIVLAPPARTFSSHSRPSSQH